MNSNKTKKPNINSNKKKNVTKFKNILAQPIPQYWPEISENDVEDLKQIILPIKDEQCNKQSMKLEEIGITLGLNSSLRKLKTGKCSCILISTEIKPKFIVNQLIQMILSNYMNKTKFLCVPNLKEFTNEIFNIQSLVIGFSKNEILESIENWIMKKTKEFPIQQEVLQYYSGQSQNITEKIEFQNEKLKSIQRANKSKNEEIIDFNALYLTRPQSLNDRSKRAFVPENGKTLEPLNFEISSSWTDYISFSGETKLIDNESDDNQFVNDSPYEDDKVRLLNTLERMNASVKNTNTQLNNKNEENGTSHNKDVVISKEFKTNQDAINSEFNPTIGINKKNRKRKMNSNPDNSNNKKQEHLELKELQAPVFKFVPLNVHKIQGNRNRKKKNNKNKK